jgi:hypothetical protein
MRRRSLFYGLHRPFQRPEVAATRFDGRWHQYRLSVKESNFAPRLGTTATIYIRKIHANIEELEGRVSG